MSDEDFLRIIFSGLLAMQFHPRNDIPVDQEPDIINRCLGVSAIALDMFKQKFGDDIPF